MLKDLLINHLALGEIDRTGERVDGKATIIGKLGYNWIAVLDAAYRANSLPFGKYEISLPGLQDPGLGGIFLNSTTTPADILSQSTIDPNSSKVNTAYLETQNSGGDASPSGIIGVPAAAHCFNTQIAGTTAQLGNIQTMAFVCLRKDFIDANDPTVESNLDKSLLRGISNVYMSSSTYAKLNVNVWGINSDTNQTTAIARHSGGSYIITIPILEIPAYEDRTGERIDGKATIIGRLGENWIAVLDSAYRGTVAYSTEQVAANNIDISAGIPYTSGSYVVKSTWGENEILAQELYDIHSSKWNTEYLIQTKDPNIFTAAKMCHDIIIDGKHAQMPNIQTLAFIYAKKAYIDSNDPTTANLSQSWTQNYRAFSSTSGTDKRYVQAIDTNGATNGTVQRAPAYLVCPILEIPLYKDRTGERVDGKATIAGKLGNYWIAVLDAAYRSTSLAWGTSTDIFNITILGTNYSFPYSAGEAAFLNTAQLRNNNTSRDLTNVQTSTRPAALFCRDTILAGFQCSLPNIQTMSFVRSWRTWLDSQDPTVSENQGASLSNSNLNIWTSSPKSNSATEAYLVGTNIAMSTTRTSQHGVCPILEIPLWCDDDYK